MEHRMQPYHDHGGINQQDLEDDIGRRAMAYLHHCFMSSTSSIPSTSTFTMSNIPGTGRIIDKFVFSRGGRMLQGALNRFAHRMGKGPIAAAQRVEKQLQYRRVSKLYMIFTEEPLPGARVAAEDEEDILAIRRDCLKLVSFVMNEVDSNQILALWCIRELMICHPGLCRCLSDPDVVDQLLSLNQDVSQFTLLLQETISLIQNRDQERSRILEMLDGAGLGPSAIVDRIDKSLQKDRLHKLHTLVMGYDLNSKGKYRSYAREIHEDCGQLLGYLLSEHSTAQIKILQQIRKLVATHPGLDCCFYKYLDVFRAVSEKTGSETILKFELKETLASISDRDSSHAVEFSTLLLKEGCGPAAIADCIYTDLFCNALEILFTLMVGCDLYGSQAFQRDAKAVENNCNRLMAYLVMSKSHTLQALALNQIETLVETFPGLSCCFKTSRNLKTFNALMQQNGTRNMPLLTRTFKCIMDNNLNVDSTLQELVVENGYSSETLLPFSPAKRMRETLRKGTKDAVLALLRDLPDGLRSEDTMGLRKDCSELMGFIESKTPLVRVLALKHLEQILFEYSDFGFFLVKEHAGTIRIWRDGPADIYPRAEELKYTIADQLEPKMSYTSMEDWTNSKFVDHMFNSSLNTRQSQEIRKKQDLVVDISWATDK